MARHFYTVVEAFRSIGPAGVRDCKLGDEVILGRPARPGRHLQFVKCDDEAFVMGGGGSGPPKLPSVAEIQEQAREAFHELREECVRRIAAAQEAHDADKATLQAQLAAAQEEVAALRAMLAGGGGSGPPTLPSVAPEAPVKKR